MSSDDEYSDEDHGDSQRSIYSQFSLMNNVDSDEDICTEFDVSDRRKPVVEVDDFEYTVFTAEQIVQDQRNIIDEVNNVLHLSPQLTRIILNHYKWDRETLFEKYFESSPEEFFKQAQVVNPFETTMSPASSTNVSLCENYCGICYCPCDDMKGLACGHTFCSDCWKQYLANKTCSEGLAHSITCPASDCDILVDDVSFVKLADNPEVIARYQQLITNTFVECNPLMRWCPAPSCTNAIKVSYCEPRAVQCTCGHEFCFGCGENWHEPVSCVLLKRWLKKNFEDSDTSNWIARNTKECPKCNATIEKDGGCNHMVCKNASCRYDFCWVCLGPWEPHGSSWYSCNRFDEDDGKQARQAQELCRSAMSRYLHYYNRYVNHMMSRRMEHKLYARVEEKMNEMQKNIDWIEVQFLKDAVDVLCQCRTTLLYSYVFAFYLKINNQKIIFEDNQRDMEMATEKISEFLEREITVKNLCEVKQEVLDLSHYCRRRGTVLLCHVREGYEKDWWDFID